MLEFTRTSTSDGSDIYTAHSGVLTITAVHELGTFDEAEGWGIGGGIDLYVTRDGGVPELVGSTYEGAGSGLPGDQYLDEEGHYERTRWLDEDVDAFFHHHPPADALNDFLEMRRHGYSVERRVDPEFGGVLTEFFPRRSDLGLPAPSLSASHETPTSQGPTIA